MKKGSVIFTALIFLCFLANAHANTAVPPASTVVEPVDTKSARITKVTPVPSEQMGGSTPPRPSPSPPCCKGQEHPLPGPAGKSQSRTGDMIAPSPLPGPAGKPVTEP